MKLISLVTIILLVVFVVTFASIITVINFKEKSSHESIVESPKTFKLKISDIQAFIMKDRDEATLAPFKKIAITYQIKNKTEYEVLDYKLIVEINYLDCTEKTLEESITQYHDNPILPGKLQIAQVIIELPKEKCELKVTGVKVYIDAESITGYSNYKY